MQGNDKNERFLFRRPLIEFALSLFIAAQILHLIRRMNRAVSRVKNLCHSYRMRKH